MLLSRRQLGAVSGVVLLAACTSRPEHPAPRPVGDHPRLLVRRSDLDRLRQWASDDNPVYRDGLSVLAGKAKKSMDDGHVPAEDAGSDAYETYPTEWYAELFAFMSLIERDQPTRDEYGRRARNLLMHIIDKASAGAGSDGEPFRGPRFATFDRSRWNGEAFGLTVDWAYAYFSTDDKRRIRDVFLRWSAEQFAAYPSEQGGGGAADFRPDGPFNDPAMLADQTRVRWAMNNYYNAHMRNMGLMAAALDSGDDPDGRLRNYLRNVTGQWLYMTDHAMRTVSSGGLSPEGTEYSLTALAFHVQLLVAMHTAGLDDAAKWGPQVVMADNPFWADSMTANFHTLPPKSSPAPPDANEPGDIYQVAAYGDLQVYAAPDLTNTLAPMAIYARSRGDQATVDACRWHMINVPAGGAGSLLDRVGSTDQFNTAILYFLTLDPHAPQPKDPRPGLPLQHQASGLNRFLSRTSWSDDARIFTYSLTWKSIDHQGSDGNEFELYRKGEWLTKQRTGYDTTWYSDYHNTLTIENAPLPPDSEERYLDLARRGAQVPLVAKNDPTLIAQSSSDAYFYACGDATNLYNEPERDRTEVAHASRSLVWLKPDHVVVYDRAETHTDGRFKRFWLQAAAPFEVTGTQAVVKTPGGQRLFSTTLLPEGAMIRAGDDEPDVGRPSAGEPMRHRLMVGAAGNPRSVRFLHVVQGADGSSAPDVVTLIRSSSGTAYEGAVVGATAVLFPVTLGRTDSPVTLSLPGGVSRLVVTGLDKNTGYRVERRGGAVTVALGGNRTTDGGGVLAVAI
ncbi:hypothetical protein A9W99_23740 [Mycobacterium sp. 1164966.3]|uniref:hypothetical protein n=1 Tax=Mycobacterium sp. 1164966.3 TaxID=1856861 RepID=UPI000800671F|nr:hypothetical protein [Mycobacterium sp. 1164966.3]OBA78676.1 hypothetical protein A9W99_23740 [Mycobacterium sp. 1164966.3]